MYDSEYATLFEKMYPKSIAISHREYLEERCSNRTLIIYGTGKVAVDLNHYLAMNKIYAKAFIDDTVCEQKTATLNVISLVDLVYMDIGQYFVILARDDENYGVSRQKFLDLGLREDVDFTYYMEIPGTNELFHYDVTLSFSRIRQKYEGFEVFGDESNSNAIRIVALGGSTTECSLFYVKGWVHFLFDYLKQQDIPVVIYGGGVSSYISSQELLKLIRDVIPLNPDIVISYSGVNDLYSFPKPEDGERYKRPFITRFQVQFINQILERLTKDVGIPVVNAPSWNQLGHSTVFYGLKNNKSAAEFWIDNERMMHALCNLFDIRFFGFYQPFRFNGSYLCTPLQEIIHSRRDLTCVPTADAEKRWGATVKTDHEKIVSEITNYDFLSDFSNIFDRQSEVFYDTTHVYEKGNQIIARRILDRILPCILSLQPKQKRTSLSLHLDTPVCSDKSESCKREMQLNGIDYYTDAGTHLMCSVYDYKCGDHVLFGGDNWVILYIYEAYALVLSEKVVTLKNYHNTLTSVTWEESNLRRWLNTEFLQRFTEKDRRAILPAITVNHSSPCFETDGGITTVDHAFLLSYDDFKKFIVNDPICCGQFQNTPTWWWLRTPGMYSDRAVIVHEDGHAVLPGYYVKLPQFTNSAGVRPAMLLNINSLSPNPDKPEKKILPFCEDSWP